MVCNFEWAPDIDQVIDCTEDKTLGGTAARFGKEPGKSFTMNAPGHKLTLRPTNESEKKPIWSGTIDVKQGNFIFDVSDDVGEFPILFFGLHPGQKPILTVEENGQFSIVGPPKVGGGLEITSIDDQLDINVKDNGLVDINCMSFNLSPNVDSSVNIAVTDQARMSVVAPDFVMFNVTVDVKSSTKAGPSLKWVASDVVGINLVDSSFGFSDASIGFLRGPTIALRNAAAEGQYVRTVGAAKCTLEFDTYAVNDVASFVLGLGAATMQFDGFSPGSDSPFDFFNKQYPQGLFEITSRGSVNGGRFLIRTASRGDANLILSKKLVAIDGVAQDQNSKILNVDWDGTHAVVKQTGLPR
jgi:hypothetical protein